MGDMTLFQIIEAVRNGERPDYDDLRYAVCAMEALATFDSMAFKILAEAEREGKKPFMVWSATWQMEESFRRHKTAAGMPPKEYVGWNDDPDNPEFHKHRAATLRMVNKILDGQAKPRQQPPEPPGGE